MTDQSKNPSAKQLIKLSEEVSRIAERLARISTNVPERASPSSDTETKLEISVEGVKSAIRARRVRARYFSEDLFGEPAWDMMLELLIAELACRRVTVSAVCAAAAVPHTTALRWLNTLVQKGLLIRRDDPLDGRRTFVELAPEASVRLRAYFRETT